MAKKWACREYKRGETRPLWNQLSNNGYSGMMSKDEALARLKQELKKGEESGSRYTSKEVREMLELAE